MPTEIAKTLTYLTIHLGVGFTVAYLLTGSLRIAGGIALVEPCVNAVAFFFHERAWKHDWQRWRIGAWLGRLAPSRRWGEGRCATI